MKHLYLTVYRYRGLDEEATRALTKRFMELGSRPGILAHYERLDGKGGYILEEAPKDPEADYERILQLNEWLDFEVIPITTMEDAFPVVLRHFG